MRVYASVAAATGWALVVLLYVADAHYRSLAHTITFFSYFSVLSNILAALTLTVVALGPAARGQWLLRPAVAGAIMLYMCVTGLAFAIRAPSDWQGWRAVALTGLHHVMPIAFLTFWIVFIPKGSLTLRDTFLWLIFPLLYVTCLLLCGPCYTFLNAGVLGFERVARNIGLMAVAFMAMAQSLVLIDRVLGRARREAAADRSQPQASMSPAARYLYSRATPFGR
jgi:hypothetical protein